MPQIFALMDCTLESSRVPPICLVEQGTTVRAVTHRPVVLDPLDLVKVLDHLVAEDGLDP